MHSWIYYHHRAFLCFIFLPFDFKPCLSSQDQDHFHKIMSVQIIGLCSVLLTGIQKFGIQICIRHIVRLFTHTLPPDVPIVP